jgi:hypothetical protein
MEEPLNTLVYKRTHKGDPDESGIFGIHDCMGRVRGWPFDAVIGVGGKCPWSGDEGIALKINWIGINPSKGEASSPVWFGAKRPDWSKSFRGPFVTFDRFVFLDEKGPDFKKFAPNLFRHMFEDQHVRLVMSRSLPREMQEEVQEILRWAENHQPRNLPSKLVWQERDFTVTPPRVFEKKISTKRKC